MSSLRAKAFALVFGPLLLTNACSLLADFDGLTDPPPPSLAAADGGAAPAEGGSGDGGPNEDAALVDAQPGAVLVDDFEEAKPTCGWTIETGTASPDPLAHTGSGACRMCSTGGKIRIDRRLPERRAGSYQLAAYVRRLPDASAPTQWAVRLSAGIDGGGIGNESTGAIDEVYRLAQVTLPVTAEASSVSARIGVEYVTSLGTCILVDDVVVTWSPP